MAAYITLVESHKTVEAAVSWKNKALAGIAQDRIVSITQSTASTSGPGSYDWDMTTMIVLRDLADPSAAMRPASETTDQEDAHIVFDVSLKGCRDSKVPVINLVRAVTGRGLKEAKALVDNAPQPIAHGLAKDVAERLQAEFLEAGAVVELNAYRGR